MAVPGPSSDTIRVSVAKRNEIARAFADALSPYIGRNLAGASLRGHFEKLGIEEREVTEAEVAAVIQLIKPGLHVFVGRERASSVVDELYRALDRLGGAS
jgi:hypothetical protein